MTRDGIQKMLSQTVRTSKGTVEERIHTVVSSTAFVDALQRDPSVPDTVSYTISLLADSILGGIERQLLEVVDFDALLG